MTLVLWIHVRVNCNCSLTPSYCFQAEIEKYKAERERAFADYEAKFAGAKDDIATRFAILVWSLSAVVFEESLKSKQTSSS